MSVSPVHTHFIKPLLGLFKRPPGADGEGYFKLLKERLARFEPVDLEAASAAIADSAETQTWPALSVCIRFCEEAKARREAEGKTPLRGRYDGDESGKMPEDAAMRILAADAESLALAACDGDWIAGLIDFVREHRKIPQGREVDDIRASAAGLAARIEAHVHANPSDRIVGLLVGGVQARRARLAEQMKQHLRAPL